MIRHIVLTKLKPQTPEHEITALFAGLAALTDTLPGAQDITGGRSDSPEQLERGYTHGFVIDFDSWDDLKTYADHPQHRALGARLVSLSLGGIDGVLVLDLDVQAGGVRPTGRDASAPRLY